MKNKENIFKSMKEKETLKQGYCQNKILSLAEGSKQRRCSLCEVQFWIF